MTIEEFFASVEAEPRLEGIGWIEGDAGRCALIRERRSGITTEISLTAIRENGWDVMAPILLGLKSPNPIYHISRVCGYYSRVENWNESKAAERKDRAKGEYLVPNVPTSGAEGKGGRE